VWAAAIDQAMTMLLGASEFGPRRPRELGSPDLRAAPAVGTWEGIAKTPMEATDGRWLDILERTPSELLPMGGTGMHRVSATLRRPCLLAATIGLALVASVVGTAVNPADAQSVKGGTVTFAQPVGSPPTYIFPLWSGAASGNNNITYMQPLMWRPLYWFGHSNSPAPSFNASLSLADKPVISNGGLTATVTMKHYLWSDGQPVTSRDVEFYMNLLVANKDDSGNYAPGDWIDHVANTTYPSPYSFSITFNQVYSRTYLLANAFADITPIPQHAWDKTSASAAIGNYDQTPAGARSVYNYLNQQSDLLSTWDTNPLWQVVDGPFRLEPSNGFAPSTGLLICVPNTHYSGPVKPKIARLEELPFTSDTAEVDALVAGRLDYGYLPVNALAVKARLQKADFRVATWLDWGFTAIVFTFPNRADGAQLRQLYVRQALQHLVNEPELIKRVFYGYATPTYGPIPADPANSYVSGLVKGDPLPYSPADAAHLLTAHGWHIVKDGVSTCQRPGTGPSECGAGMRRGASLKLKLLYTSGVIAYSEEMQALQSSLSALGIQLTLQSAPYNQVLTDAYSCDPGTGAGCGYPLGYLGSPNWTYVPGYFPVDSTLIEDNGLIYSGEPAFVGKVLKLIQTADTNSSLANVYKYENYMATEVPFLWLPNADYQISVISKHLHGIVAQDSTGHIYPEDWYVTS
jgi:peptide/nickel transport system substrate-binding protein